MNKALLAYLRPLKFAHKAHPRLNEFTAAMAANDSTKVTSILQEFSLLSSGIYYEQKPRTTESKAINEYFQKYWQFFGDITNPKIMYEVLAAGFPVLELALALHCSNNKYGLSILCEILPSLTEKEVAALEANATEELNVCMIAFIPPRIPLNLDGALYDLGEILKAIDKSKDHVRIGYANVKLFEVYKAIVLDLKYLQQARSQLIDNENPNRIRSESHAALEQEALINQTKLLARFKTRLAVAKANRAISLDHHDELRFIVLNGILSIYVILFATRALMWGISLQNASIRDDLRKFDNVLPTVLGLFTAIALIPLIWSKIDGKLLTNHNACKTFPKYIPGLAWLGLAWLYKHTIQTRLLLADFENMCVALDEARIKKDTLEFNYVEAQRTLPMRIAQRFSKEYADGNMAKSTGLLFWSQAFNTHPAEGAGETFKAYNNMPAYRILI